MLTGLHSHIHASSKISALEFEMAIPHPREIFEFAQVFSLKMKKEMVFKYLNTIHIDNDVYALTQSVVLI